MTLLYVLALSFSLGIPGEAIVTKTLECANWPCVQRVLAATHTSPTLTRIQVFHRDRPYVPQAGGTPVWPPVLDGWLG